MNKFIVAGIVVGIVAVIYWNRTRPPTPIQVVQEMPPIRPSATSGWNAGVTPPAFAMIGQTPNIIDLRCPSCVY